MGGLWGTPAEVYSDPAADSGEVTYLEDLREEA